MVAGRGEVVGRDAQEFRSREEGFNDRLAFLGMTFWERTAKDVDGKNAEPKPRETDR